jgi:hypothetical protein
MPRNVNHSICGCLAEEAAASATSLHFLPTLLSLIIPLSLFCQNRAEIYFSYIGECETTFYVGKNDNNSNCLFT